MTAIVSFFQLDCKRLCNPVSSSTALQHLQRVQGPPISRIKTFYFQGSNQLATKLSSHRGLAGRAVSSTNEKSKRRKSLIASRKGSTTVEEI
ncbi:hypothetical protein NXS19_011535 [Fusarium pseudograminearum]|nr:hypothetical protein NXS19_011535 [Fusarium pseudograminearum]